MINKYFALIGLVVLWSHQIFAVSFIPISFDEQVEQSDSIVHAVVKGNSYKKASNDEVVTMTSLKILSYTGISNSRMVNPNSFKVVSPGGVWNGIVHKIDASPKFKEGEEVVLFLKETGRGFVVLNLALGKYKVEKYDGEKILKSEIFPKHPLMKPLPLSKLKELVSVIKRGETFKGFNQKQAVVKRNFEESGEGRGPASLGNSSKNQSAFDNENGLTLVTLVILFLLIGIVYRYAVRNSKN
ncbi:MAG: hypothetical protein ACPGJV_07485 [Bacteriovoracaceae bacterium]